MDKNENNEFDIKEFIHACEIERERMVIEAKMSEREQIGRKEGLSKGKALGREEGIAVEKLRNAKSVIESIYGKHDLSWLDVLKKERINQVFTIIGQGYTYEQLKEKLING